MFVFLSKGVAGIGGTSCQSGMHYSINDNTEHSNGTPAYLMTESFTFIFPWAFHCRVRMCSKLEAGLFLTHGAQLSWDYCLVVARCCKYHSCPIPAFNWLSYLFSGSQTQEDYNGLDIPNPIQFC